MGDYLRGGGGGLFNLEKMIVSVLHKGLEYTKWKRSGIRSWSLAAEDQ